MQKRIISIIAIFSIIFFLAISFDLTPLLRGPGVYPPDWRWPYQFSLSVIPKIWLPLLLISVLLWLINKFDNKDSLIKKNEKKLVIFLFFWLYFFILAVLFFSRSGIFVLIDRIINPGANGQFSASLKIQNLISYLSQYGQILPNLTMHAKSHPPGGIVLYWFLNSIFNFLPNISLITRLIPSTADVAKIWTGLIPGQKETVIFSAMFIPFLLSLPSTLIYYLTKMIYNAKIAFRSIIIYATIPSVIFFVPLLDGFYNLFPLVCLILLIKAVRENDLKLLFVSGILFALGLFFTLSIAPFLLFYGVILSILFYKKEELMKSAVLVIRNYLILILGIIFFFLLLLPFNINILSIFNSVLSRGMVQRTYFPWVIFNFYDFFVFSGFPVFIIFIYLLKDLLTNLLSLKFIKANSIFIAFLVTLITVDIFGLVRGEAGRLFLVFIPFLVIPIAYFLTDRIKLNTKFFITFIFIQSIQVLVMQTFWVMLW